MKHYLPHLESLKAFEAAARHLSFSFAADELCISKGAISYQIRKLEEQINSTLFKRSVRQVYLTDAGQKLLQTTRQLFAELAETLTRLQSDIPLTSVSIAATTYVAARWLSSRISRFSEQHPNIEIIFQHSVNSAEFKLADADLAIRWGPSKHINDKHSTDKQSIDKHSFAEIPMSLFPVISPTLLNNTAIHTDIKTAFKTSFKHIPLLCEERQQDLWQEWFNNSIKPAETMALMNPKRVISDANVRVQAAIDGQGLILADDLMINEINNKLLIAPFTEKLSGYGYTFLSSANRPPNVNATTLKKWLLNNT